MGKAHFQLGITEPFSSVVAVSLVIRAWHTPSTNSKGKGIMPSGLLPLTSEQEAAQSSQRTLLSLEHLPCSPEGI